MLTLSIQGLRPSADRKHVIIVGAGFGGLRAARTLTGKGFDITLIDRQNYHLFQPLLYQVATASLEQEAIAYPVRAITRRWKDVRFRLAEVIRIDLEDCLVHTDHGSLSYDYLILAAGSVTSFFGMSSISRHAHDLKDLADAGKLRSHLLSAFERADQIADPAERAALLTFVVVGGGATGVEFAGALAELARRIMPKDYPRLDPEEVQIMLVEMRGILAPYAPSLQEYALHRLEGLGVQVVLGKAVTDAGEGYILLDDKTRINTNTLLWAAGIEAAPIAESLSVPKSQGKRLTVEPNLSLPDHPEVFAVGDMIYVEQGGSPLPSVAPVAVQEGDHAAEMIIAHQRGNPSRPFIYKDRGSMAVIGRGAAVAEVFGMGFSGIIAWGMWLFLHIAMLIGFRNRLWVLANWAYDYLLFDRQARLITRSGRERS